MNRVEFLAPKEHLSPDPKRRDLTPPHRKPDGIHRHAEFAAESYRVEQARWGIAAGARPAGAAGRAGTPVS